MKNAFKHRIAGFVCAFAAAGALALLVRAGAAHSLAGHMALHIFLMNVIAPVAAFIMASAAKSASRRRLLLATLIQLALFFGWHAPPAMAFAMKEAATLSIMHVSLFAAAYFFWREIVLGGEARPFASAAALLVTGKLFCLLAAIFIFAPRVLYGAPPHPMALDDQQLSGLFMVTACPLVYVGAAILILARWFAGLIQPARPA